MYAMRGSNGSSLSLGEQLCGHIQPKVLPAVFELEILIVSKFLSRFLTLSTIYLLKHRIRNFASVVETLMNDFSFLAYRFFLVCD